MQEFYVLKEGDQYFPMAFVSPADAAGDIRKEGYKLSEGETIVRVRFEEITS